jgi:hypothetical protein
LTIFFHVLQTTFVVGLACAIWNVKWWDMYLIKALDIDQWGVFSVLLIIIYMYMILEFDVGVMHRFIHPI